MPRAIKQESKATSPPERGKATKNYATGERHGHWKGDSGGYRTVHAWMNKWHPRVGRCEHCGQTERRTVYAMVDRERLTRDRRDWMELCDRCHYAYDADQHPPPPSWLGKKRSPESIAASAAKRRGQKRTPEQRARMSKPRSPQGRANILAGQRRRRERERLTS